jgi:flagellar hook-length control protein FliK
VNGLTPPKSGAAEWPPGPTPRASRGAPDPSDSFAGILNSQARTATAEGQDRSPKVKGDKRRDDDVTAAERAERKAARRAERREADGAKDQRRVQHHADKDQAQPANSVEQPAAPVAVADPVVPQVDVAQLPVPAAPVVTPVAVETAPVAPQTPAQQPQAAAVVAAAPEAPKEQPQQPQQQTQQQVQQPVVASEAAQAEAAPQVAADADADAAVVATDEAPTAPQADAKPAARPEQAAVAAAPKPKQQAGDNGSQQQGEPKQQGSLPQQAAEQARTVAQAYGRPQHTSTEVPTTAQSGQPAASPATPVAGGQPVAARGEFAPATPVPLARAAENVEHVLRLAANRGVTHARIALNPESLGSVDVHLRHTKDGLVATVVAHSSEAVHQLQQAAADLRRQLEGQGVNLLSLDIGQSSDDRSAAGAGTAFADAQGERNDSSNAGGSAAGADEETTVKSTLQLPNGVLVDVLA